MSLLGLYHRLPAWARSAAASVYGASLYRTRYGRDTDRLAEEARERETWTSQRWERWRQERLAYLLHRAATKVPYYREQWARRRAAGFGGSWEQLENWPVLEKDEVRRHGAALVVDDRNPSRLHCDHTSGTSGTPLNLWQSRETLTRWYALMERRWRGWYGLSRHDRWAILGGRLVAPASQQRPPFWVWNAAMRQLYLSSYHLSPANIPAYGEALRRYRIRYVLGYSSSLYALAQGILDAGAGPLPLDVVLTNAEPLYDYQREAMGSAFGCPVRETYGMSEMAVAASECEAGTLHFWPDAGVVEIVGEAEAGEITGDLIATGLSNDDMPLIRYRTGDRATIPAVASPCACGRSLPVLSRIEGRSDDVLYTPDGRAVGRLDPVFKGHFRIREAQIVQERLDTVRLRYVPAPGCSERDVREMADQIRSRMDGVRVVAEALDAIPRGANNKFRAVVCQVPKEELPKTRPIRVPG